MFRAQSTKIVMCLDFLILIFTKEKYEHKNDNEKGIKNNHVRCFERLIISFKATLFLISR